MSTRPGAGGGAVTGVDVVAFGVDGGGCVVAGVVEAV
jgi:hypothetical protein